MLEFDEQAQGERPQLALHVKADVQGSAEAVRGCSRGEPALSPPSLFVLASAACLQQQGCSRPLHGDGALPGLEPLPEQPPAVVCMPEAARLGQRWSSLAGLGRLWGALSARTPGLG